jgi:hypothetical protein
MSHPLDGTTEEEKKAVAEAVRVCYLIFGYSQKLDVGDDLLECALHLCSFLLEELGRKGPACLTQDVLKHTIMQMALDEFRASERHG